jgi:SAM-dependent methyltransferase
MRQAKQHEWSWQWERVPDVVEENVAFLWEWLQPHAVESFRGETVLDAGCGSGLHSRSLAPYCKRVVAVDLNAAETARRNTASLPNVEVVEGDIATIDFPERFDTVLSLGVVHHTDDPDRTVENLGRLVRPGGRLLVRVYSHEGNLIARTLVEAARRTLLRRLPRAKLLALSRVVAAGMWVLMRTIYRLPLTFLPYYRYLRASRRLSFSSNVLNVFDKLNAPQTHFIRRERVERWFDRRYIDEVLIALDHGTTWRCSGRKRAGG